MTGPLVSARMSVLLSLVAGVVMWLAFPPVSIGPYAAVAVALLVMAQYRAPLKRVLLTGFLAGIAFFGLLISWMEVIGIDAWLLLAGYCAGWIALVGVGTALVTRLPGWPVWVACLWVLQEALRGAIPFGGFPWGRLAFAQPDTSFGKIAVLFGQAGVTFALALAGASVVAAVIAFRAGHRPQFVAWSVLAAVVTIMPGLIPLPLEGDTVGGSSTAVVAVVQGGTPQTGMGAMDVRRAVLDNHVRETMELGRQIDAGAAPQPDFVLWPENSADIDPYADLEAAATISAAANAVGAPIIVGAVVEVPDNPDGVWNLGIVWDPATGPGARYAKTHPVPFGEYIPFRAQLEGLISRLDRIPRDFIPGDVPGLLDAGGILVGDVICFEVAYDDVVSGIIDGGARIITVQTNNATYAGTAQPMQQVFIERMRAIETGRTVAVAATSGISAILRPNGSYASYMGEDETGSSVQTVQLRGEVTLASRLGSGPSAVASILAIGALIAGGTAGVIERRTRRNRLPE
jgi:apolipoprotein N-acyltransferase